jgi:hypothetical protein
MDRRLVGVLTALLVGAGATATAADGAAQEPRKYQNCTALNKVYPHGVGRKGARDRTTGIPPVTNFALKVKVYKLNASRLDRDDDGIACEKL